MSQMNKERKATTSASRIGDVPKKDRKPLPTDADLQALLDAGVDYTDFLKIFFKGKKNDE